jgi:DNA ligase D-like protein (predicted 3'-phosphoesterase)
MIFVVQKHDATNLHYDFRLEHDGVLLSWAVPKGPSLDPSVKRLAVPVEDHPLDYADFEGRIGPGYGEGAVIVWDTGPYDLERGSIDDGHITFTLHGEKLRGGWSIRRFRENWLLVKKDDAFADRDTDILVSRPESVLSGRTIETV